MSSLSSFLCFLLIPSTTAVPLPAPRSDFYLPSNLTYFNPATLGPTPRTVVEQMHSDTEWLEANPANHYFGMFQQAEPETRRMDDVRQAAANFLGTVWGWFLIKSVFGRETRQCCSCCSLIKRCVNACGVSVWRELAHRWMYVLALWQAVTKPRWWSCHPPQSGSTPSPLEWWRAGFWKKETLFWLRTTNMLAA